MSNPFVSVNAADEEPPPPHEDPSTAVLPSASSLPSKVKRRYAVFFDEGSGYLLVDALAEGGFGVVMLVLSLANNRIYARKLHDVQKFKSDAEIQCEDVQNLVRQSHVPRLKAYATYQQNVQGEPLYINQEFVQFRETTFVTAATTWDFCNGGCVHDLICHWDEGSKLRIPEPVIWRHLATLLKTCIEISHQGIAHRDVHEGNTLLHWPSNSPLPELCLIDFGLAQRFPVVSDHQFDEPWSGTFDEQGLPDSDIISNHEKGTLRYWYLLSMQDMRKALYMIETFIFCGRNDRFLSVSHGRRESLEEFFRRKGRSGSTVNGYSAKLIQATAAWSNILDAYWVDPPQLMANLKELRATVQRLAVRRVHDFLQNPQQAHESTSWMRPLPHATRLAVWKDPRFLLGADTDEATDTSITTSTMSSFSNNVTSSYRSGDIHLPNRRVTCSAPGMDGEIVLREGQYKVAEIAYDESTSQFQIIRIVESMSEIGPLSEDEDLQFDWVDFNNTINEHVSTNPSLADPVDKNSPQKDSSDDENDDEEDDDEDGNADDDNDSDQPTPTSTPHRDEDSTQIIVDLTTPPTSPPVQPTPNPTDLDSLDKWTQIDDPDHNKQPIDETRPLRQPSDPPDDSDEDTSRGARWRAWRKQFMRGQAA